MLVILFCYSVAKIALIHVKSMYFFADYLYFLFQSTKKGEKPKCKFRLSTPNLNISDCYKATLFQGNLLSRE